MQGLLEMQQRAGNSLEFIESVKIDLFPDEVYVFTPKGDIMELPRGATAVDFAYAVHTDVGNSCVACRINRRLAPLSEPLQSGQTVEILTAPGARPNPAWFNYAVTAKAPHQYPPLPQAAAPRGLHRPGPAPAGQGTAGPGHPLRRPGEGQDRRLPGSRPATST